MKNYKFTINNTQYDADILSLDGNIAKIEINGTPYEVVIHKEIKTPTLVRSAVKEAPRDIEKKSGGPKTEIKSPLPGIIVSIAVKPGDTITKNQKLFSLEAMKMENEIKAERDGIISAVKVSVGQSVLQEEVIMEID